MSQQLPMQTDAQSREKIIKEISSNFFVEAGAGSGKTTILVKRMVAMIESGIDVSKICAITFTKAAAGEFYARFQKKLIERSTATEEEPADNDLPLPNDETRKRCLAALNDIDLCFMGTIDSFCNMILSEHPAKAGVPSSAAVLSPEDINTIYKKEYSRIQQGHYGTELNTLCNRFRSFHQNPDKVFIGTIGTMMDTRNCCQLYTPWTCKSVDEACKAEREQLLQLLRQLLDKSHLTYEKNVGSLESWETLKTKEQLLFDSWDNNISGIIKTLKALFSLRLIPETDLNQLGPWGQFFFEPHMSRNKVSWYELSDSGLPALYQKLRDIQYAVTMEFLEKASDSIAKVLRRDGNLTFFDYLLYLRDMLKADASEEGRLITHIYHRHSYFLIDEFQDTNPMQAEIFFYLTAKRPVPDWRKCIPQNGSLFIVGDPKQSIYRFRYADVASFLKVKELFHDEVGEVLYLTRNFRSTYKMRQWFNTVFQNLLPNNTGIQSRYELIPLEDKPADDKTFSGIYYYNVSGFKGAPPEEKDPKAVARIIRRIVGNPAYVIHEGGNTRAVTYQDIMLITPRKTKLSDYMRVFQAEGIPFRVEGSVSFDECPALIAVSKIFSLVANPGDTLSLIDALTCDRFRISLHEIHAFKNKGYALSLFADHEGVPDGDTIFSAIKSLKSLVYLSKNLSASALFTAILETFTIFRYVSTENLSYVYYALELLRNAEANGRFASPAQAAVFLQALIRNESDAERTISLTRNENRLHLANLHKVKGLEAPIVILADPTASKRTPALRVTQEEPQPRCRIFELAENRNTLITCSGFDQEKTAEQECLDAEKIRLLYVAATRARRVLLIANEIKSDGTDNDTNLWYPFIRHAEGEFFKSLPQGKEKPVAQKQKKAAAELYQESEKENFLRQTSAFESSYEIRRPSQIKLKGKSASEDNFEDEASTEIRTNMVRKDAALIGTMVHSLMEALVSSRGKTNLSALVEEIAAEYEAENESYLTILTQVANTMLSGGFPQNSDVPKDILNILLSADEVYCELPFCRKTLENGKAILWHGIMDVVYRKGNDWYIIDYKTNAEASDLDKKYQEQLAAYRDAFHAITGKVAQAMIYHIDV